MVCFSCCLLFGLLCLVQALEASRLRLGGLGRGGVRLQAGEVGEDHLQDYICMFVILLLAMFVLLCSFFVMFIICGSPPGSRRRCRPPGACRCTAWRRSPGRPPGQKIAHQKSTPRKSLWISSGVSNGLSVAFSNMSSLFSGIFQRIVTFPMDFQWIFQWNFTFTTSRV